MPDCGQAVRVSIGFFFPETSNHQSHGKVEEIDGLKQGLDDFNIFHLNVQSLSNKVNLLSLALEGLRCNIVCVSEHWLTTDNLSTINLKDYNLHASYCRGARLHGGVAIYARDGLVCTDVGLARYSLPFHAEFAGVWVAKLNCIVVTVYRSCKYGKFPDFFRQLENMLDVMFDKYKNIIILGDFNCDPIKYPNEAKTLNCIMTTYDLVKTIDGYTRITAKSASCLDNIYINFCQGSYRTSIFDPAISDHAGQIIAICHTPSVPRYNFVLQKVVSIPGLFRLKNMLADFDWKGLGLELMDGENGMTGFVDVLLRCMSDCMTVKISEVRMEERSPVAWYTDELRSMRNTLMALKTVCNAGQSAADWHLFKSYRNAYRRRILETKKAAYNTFIMSSENRQKSCWKIINHERKSNKNPNITSQITADQFNVHFVEVAEKIIQNVPASISSDVDVLDGLPTGCSSLFIHPVTPAELLDIIMCLESKNCFDCYNMNAKILKFVCNEIIEPLSIVINNCIIDGVFPYILKISRVVPIHKKGKVSDVGNYRPIAISPVLSKVFESVLKKRLLAFFEKNKTISLQQFGFKAGSSTVHTVLKLLEDVVAGFDRGQRTEVILCDLTKAFDCVSSTILLDKLQAYGVRGVCLQLLRSYLCDRRQYVLANGEQSKILPQTHGVPQGSVIGPLLFLIYINDLPKHVSDASTLLFADDTTLYSSHSDVVIAKERVHAAMEQASAWFVRNQLSLNLSKTKSITLATDKNVPSQETVSLLGMRIDQRLTWTSHIDQVCSRISKGIYALRNLVHLVSLDVLRMAYFSLIQSHLAYGTLLWGGAAEAQRAFIMQKKAIRVMVKKGRREHCRPWFKNLGVLTLPSLYIYVTSLHIHRIAPSLRTRADVHGYNTRGRELLVIPFSRTYVAEKNKVDFKLYNALPEDIKVLTMTTFKSRLKAYLISKAFYSVDEYLKGIVVKEND